MTGETPVLLISDRSTGIPPITMHFPVPEMTATRLLISMLESNPHRYNFASMIENIERRRRLLPHWTADRAIYFITFRLHDSLPASLAKDGHLERANIIRTAQQMNRKLTDGELERLRLLRRKLELSLDKGLGQCWMRNPEIARIVTDGLRHFDGQRYELFAWCVMPNHVHVIAQPAPEWPLFKILHSWKSFTAHRITQLYGCPRPFWQREYFDRIMRDELELQRAIKYVENNPTAAGLSKWPWRSVTTSNSAE